MKVGIRIESMQSILSLDIILLLHRNVRIKLTMFDNMCESFENANVPYKYIV